jgi:hypothetical protein
VLFLLWLAIMPEINNLGQGLVIVVLAVLAVVGIEALRRQTAQEFPPGPARSGPDRRGGGRRETRAPRPAGVSRAPRAGTDSAQRAGRGTRSWRSACPGASPQDRGAVMAAARARPVPLREVSAERAPRLRTRSASSTACAAAGSLVLLGGSPGIGSPR